MAADPYQGQSSYPVFPTVSPDQFWFW